MKPESSDLDELYLGAVGRDASPKEALAFIAALDGLADAEVSDGRRYQLAICHFKLGNKERAFEFLRMLCDSRDSTLRLAASHLLYVKTKGKEGKEFTLDPSPEVWLDKHLVNISSLSRQILAFLSRRPPLPIAIMEAVNLFASLNDYSGEGDLDDDSIQILLAALSASFPVRHLASEKAVALLRKVAAISDQVPMSLQQWIGELPRGGER